MKTSTAIVIGVVGLAAVGGFIYWQHEKSVAAAAAAAKAKSSTSTAQKVTTAIAAAIPFAGSLASLFA